MATQASSTADARLIQDVSRQVALRVVGQEYMIDRLLISLLTGGHVLLEGVPGLAKTLTVRTLAETISTSFSRIQFTPDLLPADVVGTQIYDQSTGQFMVKKGPIFANIILADEINRAPAKVQAALIVTCFSCIASSSAACTFAGARLISSARMMLAKIGPFFTMNCPDV